MTDVLTNTLAAQLRADLPPAAVVHVLTVFQTEIGSLAQALSDAAAADDQVEYRRIAHRIAGSAAAVGASALEEGARLAMSCARSHPERIGEVAADVMKLSNAARASAKDIAVSIG